MYGLQTTNKAINSDFKEGYEDTEPNERKTQKYVCLNNYIIFSLNDYFHIFKTYIKLYVFFNCNLGLQFKYKKILNSVLSSL